MDQRSSDGASSSSTAAVDKYDVFINHRGEVKKSFAGHLYRALHLRGLRPFLDQKDLQEGQSFPSQLEDVIRNASVNVAVFSPTYAESFWCLHELVLMRQSRAPIIPVFYHVNPADLRRTDQNKTKGYGLSLHQLELKTTLDPRTQEEKLRYDPATIQEWRDALSFVADKSGFDLNGKYNGDEVRMIDEIVECVGKEIRKPGLYVAKHPTGLNDKVTDFEATVLKQQQAGKIQVAGIVGLGGMGKTTLALELFNRMSSKYNKSFFLSDVREKANKSSLHSVQKELLRGLTQGLPERELDINSIYEGKGKFEKHLKSAHVLLILDDIDHDDQLEALLPVKDVLRPDSFILITSRYKDVLERSGVEQLCVYKLTGLPREHSQQLFCSYAFCQTNPLHGFENLVDQFLQVCDGLPLALKVLGALLFRKPKTYWDAKLKESKVSPDIRKRLKISYDALSEEEQKIFLDIAFFFIGESKTSAIAVWDASGWSGLLRLTDLEGKCLVEVDDKNVIHMHDQLRDMGRQIADEETPRRLWRLTGNIDDWLHNYSSVLSKARGIWLLPGAHSTKPVGTSSKVLGKRKRYRFLGCDVMNFQLVETEGHLLDRILRVHSPNLLWLSWRDCPHTCLPSWITTKNLRVLKVEGDLLKTLWQGLSQAPLQLQELDLSWCSRLERLPDSFGSLSNLHSLHLGSCHNLERLPDSFGSLSNLHSLDLHWCEKLERLPDSFGSLSNLHSLDLDACYKLERLPDSFGSLSNLHSLDLRSSKKLERLPDSFGRLSNLLNLDLRSCEKLERLPDSFGSLSNLLNLDLRRCEKLERLPDSFGSLSNLHSLDLHFCQKLERLPDSFSSLWNLHSLDLGWCQNLERLPDSFGSLSNLHSLDLSASNLERLPDSFGSLSNLHSLDLTCCGKLERLPDSFGSLSKLDRLKLGFCNKLERLPDSFGSLSNLHRLDLTFCGKLERLPDSFGSLSNLHSLELHGCKKLERLPDSFGSLSNLHSLDLRSCEKLGRLPDSFGSLSNLHSLDLRSCEKLERLPDSFGSLSNLHSLDLLCCYKLETLPDSFGSLSNLHSLDLHLYQKLERLPDSFGSLSNLHSLDLHWCEKLERLPDSFGSLSNLHSLNLNSCEKLESLPDSFGSLSNLHSLDLGECNKLERLPDSFGSLSNLASLDLCWCQKLERLSDSFGSLSNLHSLNLNGCEKLERLPDSFGSLSNLHSLALCSCQKLERLPDSFGSLSNLHSLDLDACYKLERLADSFGSLSNLHRLDLTRCYQLERLPDSFGSLSSLRYFNASGCDNLTISSEAFGNIRTLEHIDLSGCEKVEVWPSQLGHQMSLKVVKLIGTNLKKELASAVELPSDLEVLWIGNPLLETVMPSLGHLWKLKELRLEYRGELKCLSASVEGSSQLSWLKVAACPIIHTSEVFFDEVEYPNLKELILKECINLVEIGTLPEALIRVKLSSCYNLRSIEGLCGLPMLRELHIKKCNELEELRSVETMVSLEELYAIDCAKLKSIRDLAQLTKLRRLIVEGCPQLGELEGV